MTSRRIPSVPRAIAWLIALTLFYAATEDQPYFQENVAAVVLAIAGTALAMLVSTRWGGGARIFPRDLARLARVLPRIPIDAARVSGAILAAAVRRRPLRGRNMRIAFEFGILDDPVDTGRRALVSYGVCLTPNTILIAMDRENEEALLHALLPARLPADARWPI